jgi:hypothetical protein
MPTSRTFHQQDTLASTAVSKNSEKKRKDPEEKDCEEEFEETPIKSGSFVQK